MISYWVHIKGSSSNVIAKGYKSGLYMTFMSYVSGTWVMKRLPACTAMCSIFPSTSSPYSRTQTISPLKMLRPINLECGVGCGSESQGYFGKEVAQGMYVSYTWIYNRMALLSLNQIVFTVRFYTKF